jgi:DNA-binding NarL/FixJ family response regulator
MITENKLRVLIAEDHAVVRSGLRAVINAQDDMEVVDEAEDGHPDGHHHARIGRARGHAADQAGASLGEDHRADNTFQ